MKKWLTLRVALVAAMVGTASSLVFAADPASQPATPPQSSSPSSVLVSQIESVEGTIASIDATNLQITGSTGTSTTVQLDSSTTVWKGAQSGKLADLKTGDHVRVRRTTKSGKEVAKSIQVV